MKCLLWKKVFSSVILLIKHDVDYHILFTILCLQKHVNAFYHGLPGAASQFCIALRGFILNNMIQHYVGPDENRIDITIHSMDEVMSLSEKVWAFCENHGLTGQRMYYSSLCTEELAGNIILHGFKDKKEHSIDIRVSFINGERVICFKDDGVPFNPAEAARLFEAHDDLSLDDGSAFRNIGLHIVSRISRSMTYQNTFGLNILTIII
ncbi:MAG: ATP-binding protein [Lachnospiraceae bacterium]|nr:ATP-binding protein [Lachnospiraceae bacterium]